MVAKSWFLAMLASFAAAGMTAGQTCPAVVGRWGRGPTKGVAWFGEFAVYGDGSRLRVVDLSDPGAPAEVGEVLLEGVVEGIAVDGSRAFVAASRAGLVIVDLANPASPVVLGSESGVQPAYDVAVDGNAVFVAARARGLFRVDVSDPAHPSIVNALDPPGASLISGVAVDGATVYAADGANGLRIVNAAVPPFAPLELLGTFPTAPGTAEDLELRDGLVYLAGGASGMRIIDVADPAIPVQVGIVDTPGSALDVRVAGSLAYVADNTGDLRVVDIADPRQPSEVASLALEGLAIDVAASGQHLLVGAKEGGLRILTLLDPGAPAEIAHVDGAAKAEDVALTGTSVLVAEGRVGLRVLDISDPARPAEIAHLASVTGAVSITVAGQLAYVGTDAGLSVVDVSEPSAPALLGSAAVADPLGIAVAGGIAYVAAGAEGLRLFDVSDPASPTPLASVNTPDQAKAVALFDHFALVADRNGGLRMIDVANPAAPVEMASLPLGGRANDVVVAGTYAYVAGGTGGLRTVSLADPAHPVEVRTDTTYTDVVLVGANGNHLFRIDTGLAVYSVANPVVPQFAGSYAVVPAQPTGLGFGGDGRPVIALGEGGVAVLDTAACGTAPEISVSVDGIEILNGQLDVVDFGTVIQGGAGRTVTFLISNDGDLRLSLNDAVTGAGLSIPDGFKTSFAYPGWSGAPGTTGEMQVTLEADTVGVKSGYFEIPNNDLDENPFVIPITGTVIAGPPRTFDFGTGTSPVASGYTKVTPATAYTPARRYGWLSGLVGSRDRGSGADTTRDLNLSIDATFAVDVPDGEWDVMIVAGDATFAHDQMAVLVEDAFVDTLTSAAGQFLARTYRAIVADGQLTVTVRDLGGSDPYAVINALRITAPPWQSFDFGTATSPVQRGYRRVTHAMAYRTEVGYGWLSGSIGSRDRTSPLTGPLTGDFNFTRDGSFVVDVPNGLYEVTLVMGDSVYGHDQMAIFGEGVRLATITTKAGEWKEWPPYVVRVRDQQLTLTFVDQGGTDANVVINALRIRLDGWDFDFGTPTSVIADGSFSPVTHLTRYDEAVGYGWLSGEVGSRERVTGTPEESWEYRDFNFTRDATFVVDVPNGQWTLWLVLGDATNGHDEMGYHIEDLPVEVRSTTAGHWTAVAAQMSVTDGQFTLRIADLGGRDPYAVVNYLHLSPVRPPGIP